MSKEHEFLNNSQNNNSFLGASALENAEMGMRSMPPVDFNPEAGPAVEYPSRGPSADGTSKNKWKYKVGLQGGIGPKEGKEDYYSSPHLRLKPSVSASRYLSNGASIGGKVFGEFGNQYQQTDKHPDDNLNGFEASKLGALVNYSRQFGENWNFDAATQFYLKNKYGVKKDNGIPKSIMERSVGLGVNADVSRQITKLKNGTKILGGAGLGMGVNFPTNEDAASLNGNANLRVMAERGQWAGSLGLGYERTAGEGGATGLNFKIARTLSRGKNKND